MKQITINLYSFSELADESKEKAIEDHAEFLNNLPESRDQYSREETIDSIEANDYLFFDDGIIANCTSYTGEHEKNGKTEFHFHGSTIDIS